MNDMITIPASSIAELASIGRALTQFAEKLSSGKTDSQIGSILSDKKFFQEAETLSSSFSDLSEQELDSLIKEAITHTRSIT